MKKIIRKRKPKSIFQQGGIDGSISIKEGRIYVDIWGQPSIRVAKGLIKALERAIGNVEKRE